jgi:hypothetical protein
MGGTILSRMTRLLVGLLGAAILWFSIRFLGATAAGFVQELLRFARYGLVAFWVAGLAPACFRELRLTREGMAA